MRRRVLTALGSLAVAGALALPLALPAQAAEGVLILNDHPFPDPSGCITGYPPGGETNVINRTNEPVDVFFSGACAGIPEAAVEPGEEGVFPGHPAFRVS